LWSILVDLEDVIARVVEHPDGGRMLAASRRHAIARQLRSAGSVTIADLESRFGVSPITVRRDLVELERQGLLRRTHGGAVLPEMLAQADTLAGQEDAFARRMELDVDSKRRLAEEAVSLLVAHETVFLDASTTSWFVATRIIEHGVPLTLLTNSVPVMHLVLGHPDAPLDLIGIGGALRPVGGSFVGPVAVRTVEGHFADRCFFGIKGVTGAGILTDADPLEAEIKRAMIGQSARATVLLDRSKLSTRGLSEVARISDLAEVIAHGVPEAERGPLRAPGVRLRVVG
jgi:DeoR/GlpR family transcriptional regulator of sugar metabolism